MILRCAACGHEHQAGPSKCEKCGASLKGKGSSVVAGSVPPSASGAMVFLLLCASGAGLLGFALQSQATSGPVVVGLAVLLAVFARINQAASQHRDLYNWRMEDKRKSQQQTSEPTQ